MGAAHAYVDNRSKVCGPVQLHALNGLRICRQKSGDSGNFWVPVVAVQSEGMAYSPMRRQLRTVAESQKLSAWVVTES